MVPPGGKIASIQLLRTLAAGTVAILHIGFAYADHLGAGLGLPQFAGLGQSAVALFFVVSGYVMVISTRGLGGARATPLFWLRRCIRIFPPYWLATALMVAVMLYLGNDLDGGWIATSLALVPTDTTSFQGRPDFLLWPGWTLFYEMLFYFLFGLGLRWGNRMASAVAIAAIFGLVLAGQVLEPPHAFVSAATRPVLLVFIAGIVLALLRERGWQMWPAARWLCLPLSAAAYAVLDAPSNDLGLGLQYTAWAGIPAVLFSLAVLGGPLRVPLEGLVNRLGDASYSLYLLHVPLAMLAMSFWLFRYGGAWPFLMLTTGLVVAVSLLAFWIVERPLTRYLRRKLTDW